MVIFLCDYVFFKLVSNGGGMKRCAIRSTYLSVF